MYVLKIYKSQIQNINKCYKWAQSSFLLSGHPWKDKIHLVGLHVRGSKCKTIRFNFKLTELFLAEQEIMILEQQVSIKRSASVLSGSALATGLWRWEKQVFRELHDNTQQWSAPLSIPLSIWRSVITHCIWSATISHRLLWLLHRGQRMSFMITEPEPCIIWFGSRCCDAQSASCYVCEGEYIFVCAWECVCVWL